MVDNNSDSPTADLRPIIARMREIERKCASMGSRNEEFPLMQDRVASIIARLDGGEEPSGDPLDYRKIARELFPVAHLFESTGFMSVGKEIAYIERSLIELAPDYDAAEGQTSTPAATRGASTSTAKQTSSAPKPPDHEPVPKSVPLPIVFGLLTLVMATAIAAAIVFRFGPFARDQQRLQDVVAEPTATPATPTALPTPAPTAPVLPQPTAIPRALLAEEVAAARLALAKGDLEAAANHLSEAARIDRKEPDLEEIAGHVVRGLVSWAYAAADNAEWEKAEPILERAERTAMRFGVSTVAIENARKRIAAMEHFVIIGAGDRQKILQSIGRRVDVEMADGGRRAGRIEGIEGGNLVLNMDSEVGGGVVRYSEEVPLAGVRSLKIYED